MKAPMLKLLLVATALAATVISGCAGLTTSPAAGATASAQGDIDMSGNARSAYPAATDAGIF